MTVRFSMPPGRGRWALSLVLIYVLGCAVRSAFLWQVWNDPVYVCPGHDEEVNNQVARTIIAGGMPNAPFYKAPLYMYSLAGMYRVLGEVPLRARWVQAFLFALPAVLLALVARRLFGNTTGIVAGVIGAIYWGFVFYSTELVDTSLAALLYLLLGYLLVSLSEGKWFKWLMCGIVLGLGAITRPNILASGPLLVLAILYCGMRKGEESDVPELGVSRRITRSLLYVLLFTIGAGATISPVTLHNWKVGGEFVPIATYGGLNAWSANSPWSNAKDGSVLVSEQVPDVSAHDPNDLWNRLDLNLNIARTFARNQLGRPLTVGEADRFFYARTTQYIRENPRKFAFDTFKRFCWFFNGHDYCNLKDMYRLCSVSWVLKGLSYLHWGVFCPFAVLGVVFALRMREKPAGLVYYLAMLAALFLGGLYFVMHSRFRLPTIYLSMPFAAYGIVEFVGIVFESGKRVAKIGYSALLGLLLVFCNVDWFDYSVSGHTELGITYAQACMATGRLDLLAEAAPAFEKAYWDEVANGGRPWVLTLQPIKPLTWLFAFYHCLDDRAKALRYGLLMVERDSLSPVSFVSFFDTVLRDGGKETALEVLNKAEQRYLAQGPDVVVESFLKYWGRFRDRAILVRTEKLLVDLVRRYPYEDVFARKLKDVRQLLEAVAPASRAIGPASTRTTSPARLEPARQ